MLGHGWPDSFWRYTKVIPLLTDPGAHGADPADAFDVVVPDMPGYGYSDRPAVPLDSIAVADLWAELMSALGYPRFGAAGGDLGSHVSRYLALNHPDRVVAVHRTDAGLPAHVPADLTPEERDWLAGAARLGRDRGRLRRDAPHEAADRGVRAHRLASRARGVDRREAAGVERLRRDVERRFTKDEILTNVTHLLAHRDDRLVDAHVPANAAIPPAQLARRVEVPSGFAIFRGDVVRPPRAWLERTANVVRVTEPARGGHFAAFEEPELYAQELREFFRPYRSA